MSQEKRIEVCEVRAGDLKTGFGNPRKITKKKMEELERSLENDGDFGIYLIDEENNIIGGNQRHKVVMKKYGPDKILLCKRLIGYTEAELKAINIRDNTHAGDWDLDMLADWTADLVVPLGVVKKESNPDDRKIPEMELIRYERYDYVMIVCKNEVDYLNLCRLLGIEKAKVKVTNKRKIKARAIWFDDIKSQIVAK